MRPLTKTERILARHLLQELSEQAKSVRNAMDPLHGVHTITLEAWNAQWESLTRQLDFYTKNLAPDAQAKKPSPPEYEGHVTYADGSLICLQCYDERHDDCIKVLPTKRGDYYCECCAEGTEMTE